MATPPRPLAGSELGNFSLRILWGTSSGPSCLQALQGLRPKLRNAQRELEPLPKSSSVFLESTVGDVNADEVTEQQGSLSLPLPGMSWTYATLLARPQCTSPGEAC